MEQKKMIRPIQYERADTCPNCRQERSLEAYNIYGDSVQFSYAIDTHKDLTDRKVKYLKCKGCGAQFPPRWIEDQLFPMTKHSYTEFMDRYKESYKK